jgi:SAM-dependent methyltransferase
MKEGKAFRYRDYIEHYRMDGEVFDFEEEMEAPHRETIRRLKQSIVSAVQPIKGEHVLDVGCGSGWFLRELASSGFDTLYGVDISRRQYLKGKKKGKAQGTFVEGDAYDLPFGSESMNLVLMTEILEHLEEPRRAVNEAARVLKKGGRLLVTVPWKERIRYTLCIHCNRKTPVNAHLHSFDPAFIEESLSSAGLQVVRVDSLLSKALILLRVHMLLAFLPGAIWRMVDRAAGILSGRWTSILALARKPQVQ